MTKVYYNRVILGSIKYSEVPNKFQEQVKKMLIENGRKDLIE